MNTTLEMPSDVDAEQNLIVGCLLKPSAFDSARRIVKPSDMYREANAVIWRAMCAVVDSGRPVDHFSVRQELRKLKNFKEVDEYSKSVLSLRVAVNIETAASVVSGLATRRRGIEQAYRSMQRFADLSVDVRDALNGAQSGMMDLSVADGRERKRRGLDDISSTVWAQADAAANGVAAGRFGLTLGFKDFDDVTDGFQPGDLVALVARSGMGKTALALYFADHVGINLGGNVLIFEGEMTGERLYTRMLCSRAQVFAKEFRRGLMSAKSLKSAKAAAEKLYSNRVQIIDEGPFTPAMMRSECLAMKRAQGLDLVIVDYLELMDTDERVDNEVLRLDRLIRALKRLATDLGVVVFVLCQVSGDLEKRAGDDRRPRLSDIRGSRGIDAALDWAIGLYNVNYYGKRENRSQYEHDPLGLKSEEAEILTLKARNDAMFNCRVGFIPAYTHFHDLHGDF